MEDAAIDIVVQLRRERRIENGLQVVECYGCYDKERTAAADEIERLRAALMQIDAAITDGNVGSVLCDMPYYEMRRIVRDALRHVEQEPRDG